MKFDIKSVHIAALAIIFIDYTISRNFRMESKRRSSYENIHKSGQLSD